MLLFDSFAISSVLMSDDRTTAVDVVSKDESIPPSKLSTAGEPPYIKKQRS